MSEKTRSFLAFYALSIMTALIAGLFFIPIPDSSKDLVNIALGFVAGNCGLAFGFYFGSSEGSKRKTDMLNDIAEQQATGKPDDPIHVEPTQ